MVLEFSSRVVYTKHSNFRIRVDAHHINHETGERDHTNVFHYHVRILSVAGTRYHRSFAANSLMVVASLLAWVPSSSVTRAQGTSPWTPPTLPSPSRWYVSGVSS